MKCLRCGAKIQEEHSFCDGCADRVRVPLENTPYLSTRVTLPNRQERPVPKRPDPKKEQKKRPWRWIFSTLLFFLLSAALLLQGGWYFTAWLNNEAELGRMHQQNQTLQDKIAFLEDRLSQAEQEAVQVQTILSGLESDLSDTQQVLAALQEKIEASSLLVVFVNHEEDIFHRLDCESFVAHECSAYMREYAEQRGFQPCELCRP